MGWAVLQEQRVHLAPYHFVTGFWLAGSWASLKSTLGHKSLREGASLWASPCSVSPAPDSPGCAPTPQEAALCEQADTLRGPRVQDLLRTVLEHRARVKELAETRAQALHTSLLMAGFARAATQVRGHPLTQCLLLGHILHLTNDIHLPGLFQP